jgi:hypothetical protein
MTLLPSYIIIYCKLKETTEHSLSLLCASFLSLSTTFSWKNPIFFVHIREKNLQKNHRKTTVFRLIWSYEFWVVFRTGFGLILAYILGVLVGEKGGVINCLHMKEELMSWGDPRIIRKR